MKINKKISNIVFLYTFLFVVGCSSSSSESTNNDSPTEPSLETLNVAVYLAWPTPNLIAKAQSIYAERLDVTINWISFDAGHDMMEAMIANKVDIAYSSGLAPFVRAANTGAPLQTVAVATQYNANPCIVGNGSRIEAADKSSFFGKTVAVPLKTMSEYSFIRQMNSLDVDISDLIVLDQSPLDASNALVNGTVDMTCIYETDAIERALLSGKQLLSESQMTNNGIIAFDVVVVTNALANSNPSIVKEFLKVTDEYNSSFQGIQSELDLIVNESNLDQQTVLNLMDDLQFPNATDQLSEYMTENGLVFQAFQVAGDIFASEEGEVLNDFSSVINASFLQ